jgi:hypothetical protein
MTCTGQVRPAATPCICVGDVDNQVFVQVDLLLHLSEVQDYVFFVRVSM